MSIGWTWRLSAVAVCAGIAVSGCMSTPDGPTPAPTVSPDAEPAGTGETLAGLLGLPERPSVAWQAMVNEREQAHAQCMQDNGWEHVPTVVPQEWLEVLDPTPELERQRIEREGIGIMYWILNPDAMPEHYPGADWVNVNEQYQESLPYSDLRQYFTDRNDCDAAPFEAIYGMTRSEYWVRSNAYAWRSEEIAELVSEDPWMSLLDRQWVRCMADAGYEVPDETHPWDGTWRIYHQIADGLREVMGMVGHNPLDWTPASIFDYHYRDRSEAGREALSGELYVQVRADHRPQLEVLLEQERTYALAWHDCTAEVEPRLTKVWVEVEERYVRDHRDEILRALQNA